MTLLEQIQAIRMEPYDYPLEDTRIARFPVEPRDSSKLLLYRSGTITETRFGELPGQLEANSLLVYNNTKVIHARLFFHKETGAQIELFCLEPLMPVDYAQSFQSETHCEWMCLIGNLKKWKQGPLLRKIIVKGEPLMLKAEKIDTINNAHRIRFSWNLITGNTTNHTICFGDLLESAGQIPIPPYLNRASEVSDETSYQTVYSRIDGSVAAPTAGLHFTPSVLQQIDKKHIQRQEVTLHVGAGTFKPVQSDRLMQHSMHAEFISVEKKLVQALIAHQGRITAVGTTSVRTLESLYWFGHQLIQQPDLTPDEWILDQWYAYQEGSLHKLPDPKETLQALLNYLEKTESTCFTASTRLLIAPGYTFRVVNAMLTNFHQPKSTLLLLVSAFLGGDAWKKVYDYALSHNFRFLSYGDSSLLIP